MKTEINSTNVKIRKAGKTDLKEIATVYANAFSTAYNEPWTKRDPLDLVRHYFKSVPDLFLIAVYENKIVGGITSLVIPRYQNNELVETEFFVDPKFQGIGIGKLLLKAHLEEAIRIYKAYYIDFSAYNKTKQPMAWYKKLGFAKSDWILLKGNIEEVLVKLEKNERGINGKRMH